jgi:thiosulfate/3-mercaptopyruvate sulfurtransferase
MAENGYAKPVLVTTDWLTEHLGDPTVVVAEVDENPDLYEEGHVPGAIKLHWRDDLQDPIERDLVEKDSFEQLMSERGISNDATLVLYGDKNNWFAAYAYWYLKIYGHGDVQILDGGRQKWIEEGRPVTTEVPERPRTEYPVRERDDKAIRAFRDDVLAHIATGGRLVDVRSPQEYSGELLAMPDYPQEGALRGGHIPGAGNVPWKRAANDDGTFKAAEELRGIYEGELGFRREDDIIAYCRVGERSSHTWFVLSHLLGFPRVRNYDGSWVEWGNLVRVPIERTAEPGPDPRLKAAG